MTGIIEQYYAPLLKKHGFVPEPDNDQYGPLGLCWKLSPEVGEGSYWTYAVSYTHLTLPTTPYV